MQYGQYRMIDQWRELAFPLEDLSDPDKLYSILNRQIGCLDEEVNELSSAKDIRDTVEIIDGYCDVLWVACMVSSILGINPIPEVKRLLRKANNQNHGMNQLNREYRFNRLKRSIRKLNEYKDNLNTDKRYYYIFKDHIVAIIYRAYQGLQYTLSTKHNDSVDVFVDYCIAQVIYSNYSKCINGKLPKDNTGKITKSVAKELGIYIEPDFTLVL